jgi:hypothetical protein
LRGKQETKQEPQKYAKVIEVMLETNLHKKDQHDGQREMEKYSKKIQ